MIFTHLWAENYALEERQQSDRGSDDQTGQRIIIWVYNR